MGLGHHVRSHLPCKQQAHFLEALPRGRHQIVQTTFGQAQRLAGGRVVPTQAMAVRLAVTSVQHTAREHGGAAAQITVTLGAAQHQHLHAARRQVAQHDDRRRLAGVGEGVVRGFVHG